MIEVKVEKRVIREAENRAKEMGEINHSIRHGEGNVYGFIGEIIIAERYDCKIVDTYDYDLISKIGRTIDVKTKMVTTEPKINYECSITDYRKQNVDYYVFVRVLKDKSRAWILGWISRERYFKESIHRIKGDLDPNSSPNHPFYFKASCYNLPISELSCES